jgi:hypothetical protein
MQTQYQDFVWIHPELKRVRATGDMVRSARTEWWSESRSRIMADMKSWLDTGWTPLSQVGPDCWKIEESKAMWFTLWTPGQWILWFLLLIPTYGLAFFALFFPASIYRPVEFRVPMIKRG